MQVALSRELYAQIRAFVRTAANRCKCCLKRNMGYCDTCEARRASVLGSRMDAGCPELAKGIDLSVRHRMEVIMDQMRRAQRPLLAIDIDTRDYCSKELKLWTLNKMISLGKIRCERHGRHRVYSLVGPKGKKETQHGCN